MQQSSILTTILRQPAARIVTLSGILFVLIAWGTVIWQIVEDRGNAVANAMRENRARVVALEQYVQRTLELADLASVYLDERYAGILPDYRDTARKQITLPDYFAPVVVGAQIADARGNLRFASDTPPYANVSNRPLFRELRAAAGVTRGISDPMRQYTGGEQVILRVARSLRDAKGAFGGAVAVEVPAHRFVDFNAGVAERPEDMIAVIALRGMTLAQRKHGVVSWGQDRKDTAMIRRQMSDPNGDYWETDPADGTRGLFSQQRVRGYPIFVVSAMGEADILRPAVRRAGWFLSMAAALTLVVGALLALYLRHIHHEERAKRRLDQMRDEFAHSARVTSLSEMAAGLAHELNQPLTAASNYLAVGELLNKGEGNREAVAEQLHQVRGQIARAGAIIRRIRDYLAKGSAELRVESLDSTIADAIELARGGSGASLPRIFFQSGGAGEVKVLIDRIQIQQVLVNLIRNASEAMAGLPAGHRIIRITTQILSDELVEVRVEDQGPGFPDSVLQQFNLPFISTKAEHGLGIGLSICRRIIEVHGGELKASNREDGACVCFTVQRDTLLRMLD